MARSSLIARRNWNRLLHVLCYTCRARVRHEWLCEEAESKCLNRQTEQDIIDTNAELEDKIAVSCRFDELTEDEIEDEKSVRVSCWCFNVLVPARLNWYYTCGSVHHCPWQPSDLYALLGLAFQDWFDVIGTRRYLGLVLSRWRRGAIPIALAHEEL